MLSYNGTIGAIRQIEGMKIIPSSRKNRYIAGVIILLAAIALIVWLVSWLSAPSYELTIASTAGGSVITPGEGTFTYDEGTAVSLVAEAEEGYQFVNWTGNVSAIADSNAAATNITMNGDYSITANFLEGIEIWDWYDLDAIREDLDDYYFLMNDLDSTTAGYEELASPTANGGNGWQPIGNFTDSFTWTFDGQGYEIRDLFINRPDEDGVGLFSFVGYGVIKDIGVVNAIVTGNVSVGGLVGDNFGTVSDSYSTGSVTGSMTGSMTGTESCRQLMGVGGVVGINSGNVSYCYSTGSVTDTGTCTGSANEWWGVGGVVGLNVGNVSDSYSTSSVTGNWNVGGLVGWNHYGTVSNSHSTGTVTGESGVGGLVGYNSWSFVSYSYSTSSVTGNLSGGLVGFNLGYVDNSYSTGSVTGYAIVGGLVGSGTGSVSNSYSTGTVTGTEYVGGLVGYNLNIAVSNSYSTGSVTGNSYVGGLVGLNDGTVSNSFWDTETSGQSTSDGGTGKPTAEMKDIATFTVTETELDEPWDIITVDNSNDRNTGYVWNIVDDETYPFLSWQS